MKKFRLLCTESIQYEIDVFAENEDKARDLVSENLILENVIDSDTIIDSVEELGFDINDEFLSEYAEKIDSAHEGTCLLYKYNGKYYNVLIDYTVEETTLDEWEAFKTKEVLI